MAAPSGVSNEAFARLREGFEALVISNGDLRGPILKSLGRIHRKQIKHVFATEGSAGASGRWKALSPRYAAWKRRAFPRRRILVRTGDMKARFTEPSRPEYIQEFEATGEGNGTYRFGARSEKAVAHFTGEGSLSVRDMISKTSDQVAELRAGIVEWYTELRVPQVQRALKRLG